MKIFSLEIKNFRQYRGERKIDFSVDNKKNFTVIQGANGAGKTNLMNAITWCLYGKEEHLSSISKEKIIDPFNKKEMEDTPEDKLVEMKVRIKLGEEKVQYVIERTKRGYKEGNHVTYAADVFQVLWMSGRDLKPVTSQPNYFVNLILPQTIHDFFFFDGEKLDDFFKEDSNKRVQEAIMKVSQIELLDAAMGHLDEVKDEIRRNAKGLSSDADNISKKIDALKIELSKRTSELTSLRKQEATLEENIKEIESKIRESPSEKAQALQEERDRINDEIDVLERELNTEKIESISHLVNEGPSIYVYDAISATAKLIDEKYKKGDLPPKIREPFLKELLDEGECICGTDISNQGPHRSRVEHLLKMALFSKVDQEVTEGKFKIENILSRVEQFLLIRNKHGMKIKKIEDDIKLRQERLAEIDLLMDKVDVEESVRLESDRKSLISKQKELLEKIGGDQNDFDRNKAWLSELESDYEQELKKSKKYSELMKQIDLTGKSLETLNKIKEELVNDVRKIIESKTKQFFLNLIWKKETFEDVKIDENYNISVIHKGGWDALSVLSAGERQVLALSFMAALREAARVDAPVVIDTPLGRISGEPKENIADLLPKYLKNAQVTLLATDQEYTPTIREKLSSWVGKEYRLEYDENRDETTVRPYGTR